MKALELDVVATRGKDIESKHRVHAVVVGPDDCVIAAARECGIVSSWRSCAKPFQVMPLLESGAFDELHWGDDQLALACGSHGGEPEHVALAQGMLNDIGLEEGDLACGPHDPLSARGLKLVRESGARLSRLHNNCSGKHAGMLARAQIAGWPTYGYERREHAVQRCCLKEIARWSGAQESDISQAVDGCGVVAFGLPLDRMARAWSRMARSARAGDEVPSRVFHAMRTRPFLVGGTDRFDSVLMEECDGRTVSKIGAEGVHAVAVPELGLGIAVKVEDGASRAQFPAVLRILQTFDVLPSTLPARLEEYFHRPVRNTRGETVGEVKLLA